MTYSEKWHGGRRLFIRDGGKIWEWPVVDEIVRVEYMRRFEQGGGNVDLELPSNTEGTRR